MKNKFWRADVISKTGVSIAFCGPTSDEQFYVIFADWNRIHPGAIIKVGRQFVKKHMGKAFVDNKNLQCREWPLPWPE